MRYLLTKSEYDSLAPKEIIDQYKAANARLREMLVGDNCIHSLKARTEYCDFCPIDQIDDRQLSKRMCDLYRNHSK